jgi:UDP-N-acetyl-D-galactosamine dehydrogenase
LISPPPSSFIRSRASEILYLAHHGGKTTIAFKESTMVSLESLISRNDKIGVIGLGYVGLPLAIHLARHFDVVGYDLKTDRIQELVDGYDRTCEVDGPELARVQIEFTCNPARIRQCRLIIVAVPTPIDAYRIPDFRPLKSASAIVGRHLQAGSCVTFESTVYPGATEEVCVPIIEQESGLKMGKDFTVGYSPERINPGDREHTVDKIVKIVSGSDSQTADFLCGVYGKIALAGIHRASSIKVAEAAKVIENTQRDLNIALMNELAMIFDRIDIDTQEVLQAAGTKWNFLNFRPGLVGGHCIGVDPYYLTFKAESLGYHPEMILAGRRINDNMAKYVAEKTVKLLISACKQVCHSRVAILGLTFKENVPDLRNTKVVDIISELKDYGVDVVVNDPMADPAEASRYYGLELTPLHHIRNVDAVIVSVLHDEYRDMGLKAISGLCSGDSAILVDVKAAFSADEAKRLGVAYWRL